MILVWGISGDGPLDMVRTALQGSGAPVCFLDQRASLETEVEISVGAEISGHVRVASESIDLTAITSAYVRPYDFRRLPAVERGGPGRAAWSHAAEVQDALFCWAELTPALVVNRPSAMASNGSKPYQAAIIRAFGFETPDTLITTDAPSALAFWEHHGSVIYKSVSGVRSIVSRVTSAHRPRLSDLANCPTQFQQYICGREYRLHVVGSEIFACEIECAATDYRYAARMDMDVEIRPCPLPDDVIDRGRALASFLGLTFAGLDLRRTPDGRWYCFEVNPSPGFSFYEDATGQPISHAVVQLLIRASKEDSQRTIWHAVRDAAGVS